MAGFVSWSDLVSEMTTAGKSRLSVFQKISALGSAGAAGRWYEWLTATGIPPAISFTGTAGVATVLTGGGIDIGANVSTDLRFLTAIQAWSPTSTVVPCTALLCDFLLYYPSMVVTGTPTAPNNTATLSRYTTGAGVQCICVVQTANGATQPALTLTYTGDVNASGASPFALTSPVASGPVASMYQYLGTPFMPLRTGDTGLKKVDSYTLATGTTGTVCFILVKPLAMIGVLAINTPYERNYVVQLPSMPQILDGACLGFITCAGGSIATSSGFHGNIVMAWG